ncbi:ATP-binding protein [Streptomyces sp. NPDC006393]|uniref:sensor histidine kinase n=1 Tax=Streptomyces sp. NPDC006393 TaxID=3156763 RepID=UPI0033FDE87F
MSHLRAPAARADRREGGRHGRPVARTVPSLPETHIRPQLLRLAVLPPTAVALGAGAAVLFTVRSTGARPGLALWAVLAGASAVALAGIVTAAVAAGRAARSVNERIDALRRGTARREGDLRALVDALRHGESPPERKPRGGPPDDADEFELLAADLARAHDGAVAAVVQASRLSSQAGSEQKLEVFVNLARRLQSLVHREISILDELENQIEDPDLLKGLFHVDHLATRIRRHAENLAVLGGAVSRRQWSRPVSMTEVLRSAIAEVEQYSRVKLVPPVDGRLRGHAVADVIHLLAELVENATVFSAPQTQVLLRAGLVTSGLAVEVEDRGLGMPVGEQVRMNSLLADPDQVNVASLLADGRIGLFVVSQLAKRHGITVRLQTNIYGGVQAVLVIPQALLGAGPGTATDAPADVRRPQPPQPPQPATGDGPRRTPSAGPPYAAGPGYAPTVVGDPVTGPAGTTGPGAPATSGGGDGGDGGDSRTGDRGRQDGGGRDGRADRHSAPPSGSGSGRGAVGGGVHVPAAVDGGGVHVPAAVDGVGVHVPAAMDGVRVPPPAGAPTGGALAPGGGSVLGPVPPPGDHGRDGPAATGVESARELPPTGPQAPPAAGAGPAPLPRRGARTGRANPAEAVPGIRPEDRAAVAANAGVVPTPRDGLVRGTMGKPQLPQRRAQQHIVPQLRGGPAPRQDGEVFTGHDPGLMAAFQRGMGLAESQQRREPRPADADADAGTRTGTGTETRAETDTMANRPDEGPGSSTAATVAASRGGASSLDVPPHDASPTSEARPAPMPSTSGQPLPPVSGPLPSTSDLTARHDGSAPPG